MGDAAWDLGTLIVCSGCPEEGARAMLRTYFGHEPTAAEQARVFTYAAAAAYSFFLWALWQERGEHNMARRADAWRRGTAVYASRARELLRG